MVAASIAASAAVKLLNVGINKTRSGVIDIMRLFGADITITNERYYAGEPVADIVRAVS